MTGNPRDIAARSRELGIPGMQTHRPGTMVKRNTEFVMRTAPTTEPVAVGRKFMLTLRESVFNELQKSADQRGVTIQGLIRAVIVPEWHLEHTNGVATAAQNHAVGQDLPAKDPASAQTWQKAKRTVEEISPNRIVA